MAASKKATTGTKRIVVKGKSAKLVTEPVSSPVRYSALPKLAPAAAKPAPASVTREQIATKAYELYAAGLPGDEVAHWFAAEAQLRAA